MQTEVISDPVVLVAFRPPFSASPAQEFHIGTFPASGLPNLFFFHILCLYATRWVMTDLLFDLNVHILAWLGALYLVITPAHTEETVHLGARYSRGTAIACPCNYRIQELYR